MKIKTKDRKVTKYLLQLFVINISGPTRGCAENPTILRNIIFSIDFIDTETITPQFIFDIVIYEIHFRLFTILSTVQRKVFLRFEERKNCFETQSYMNCEIKRPL